MKKEAIERETQDEKTDQRPSVPWPQWDGRMWRYKCDPYSIGGPFFGLELEHTERERQLVRQFCKVVDWHHEVIEHQEKGKLVIHTEGWREDRGWRRVFWCGVLLALLAGGAAGMLLARVLL
jgi:hypothetical protein